MNPKTFCVIPWAHTRFNPNGQIRPCCKLDVTWPGTRSVNEISNFDQYWNSDEMRQLRSDLGQGIKNQACQTCWHDEESGKSSLRKEYNQQLGKHLDLKSINENKDGIAQSLPIALDLNLSNICNFKCVMCVPELSSRIAQEQQQYQDQYKSLGFVKIKNNQHRSDWPEQSFFQNFMQEVSPGLRILELKGGEPMLVKNVEKIIKDVENKSECSIAITTNGSVDLDDVFLESLAEFKKIWFFVSVDGIGEIGEYIRYGSDWQQVENTIKKISALDNCVFRLSTTLQFSSAISFPAIFDYAQVHGYDIEVLNCYKPTYLSLNAISPDHAKIFIKWIDCQLTIYPNNKILKVVQGYFNHYKYDSALFAQCKAYFEMLDNIRSNRCESLQKLFR
jgi:MoaA/NifB/PqqE/SkfB family radical SAM enzyme